MATAGMSGTSMVSKSAARVWHCWESSFGLEARSGLDFSLERADLDIIEANEVFGAQAVVVTKKLGCGPHMVNPNGSSVSLCHPIGA
ncbi:hypothetical protein GmRootA79_37460 [Acidovorax sp. A79]